MRPSGFVSLLLTACGDGVVSARYPGEPLFELSGLVYYDEGADLPESPLMATILWDRAEDLALAHQTSLEVETTFPARYRMALYAPPDEDTLSQLDEHAPIMAVGAVALYADAALDGDYDEGDDELVGGSDDVVLVYIAQEASLPEPGRAVAGPPAPTLDLEVGFHAVGFEGDCVGQGEVWEVASDEVDLYISSAAYTPLYGCGG